MKFRVYTDRGIITCEAPSPDDARKQVKAVHPQAQIGKVKLASDQPKQPASEPAR